MGYVKRRMYQELDNEKAKIWYEMDYDEDEKFNFLIYIGQQIAEMSNELKEETQFKETASTTTELYGEYRELSNILNIMIENKCSDFDKYEKVLDTIGYLPGDFWDKYIQKNNIELSEEVAEELWGNCLIDQETYEWCTWRKDDYEDYRYEGEL